MRHFVGALVAAACAALSAVVSARTLETPSEVDVLVVGGTAKGVAAATAAKAVGAKSVFLLTPFPYLGEDVAGTRELGLPSGAKPTLPMVRRMWAGLAGLARFDYWPDHQTPHPRAVYRNDWWDRLSEPKAATFLEDSVYYEDDVSYKCVLAARAQISKVEVHVFERTGERNPKRARIDDNARVGSARTSEVLLTLEDGDRRGETVPLVRTAETKVKGNLMLATFTADVQATFAKARIVVRKDAEAHHQYVARLWFRLANPELSSEPPSPLKAKQVLDRELVDAGVAFLTSSPVRRVLRGKDGAIVGVETVNRSGCQVIRAKQVVDATRYGVLKDWNAGLPVRGKTGFSRVIITSGAQPKADGMAVEKLATGAKVEHVGSELRPVTYRCGFDLALKDGTYPSLAAAEWEARELTWTNEMLDDADLLVMNPSGADDLEARIRAGEKLGRAAAAKLGGARTKTAVPASGSLPVWGDFDVVVVGGGTTGAPTAIAAARAGAKTLVVEYLGVLGGVGTDGMILGYYDGNHVGFTEEFKSANKRIGGRFGLYRRAETWRKMCRDAGVTVWLGAMGTGAVVKDGRVTAVEVSTEFGCGLVRARCFVDATGNSDIAARAGAATEFLSAKEFALQSAGQSPRRMGRGGINSDFGYLDDSSAWDLWLFGLRARAGAPNAWDIAKMPDSRERRRIVPDYAVNAQDVNARRPFPDVVVQARSRQDSHGYLTDDFRFLSSPSAQLYEEGERRWKFDVNVPLRSLLPKGLSGIAVVGIASGCARDVLPMVRMQADLMNMGYSVGTAAAMAAANGGEFRKIDFRALREKMVAKGILRQEVLDWNADTDVSSDAVLAEAVRTMGRDFTGSHVVYRPENRARAVPLLQAAYRSAATPLERQNYAKMLGFLGDATGAETLAEIVSGTVKIADCRRPGAFGGGGNGMDGFMIALGRTKAPCAREPLVRRLGKSGPACSLNELRALCLSLEALGDPAAAPGLAACLKAEGNHGFSCDDWRKLPPTGGYGHGAVEYDNAIRELGIARALWACGDHEGLARRTLEAYAADPRGTLSAHAKAVLAESPRDIRADLAQMPRTHPRLFATAADFAAVRERLKSDPLLATAAERVRLDADKAIADKPLEHVLEGFRLLSTARACLGRVLNCAMAYRLFGDAKYRNGAMRSVNEVLAFEDWNPRHFLDTAETALAVAVAYDWLYDDLDEPTRTRIREGLLKLAIEPSFAGKKPMFWVKGRNNWTSVCHAGLTAAAFAIGDEEPEAAEKVIRRAVECLRRPAAELAPNGNYPEGPGYWEYGVGFHLLAVDLLEKNLGTSYGLSEIKGWRETSDYPNLLTGPTGLRFNYSDGGMRRGADQSPWWFARRYGRPDILMPFELGLFRQAAEGKAGRDRLFALTLLWYRPVDPAAENKAPLVWQSEGVTPLIVQRSSWKPDAFFVAIKAGTPSENHGHMDGGSFVLDAAGVRWAHDLGAEGYYRIESRRMNLWSNAQDSDRWKVYRLNNFSHNTLVIGGEKQLVKGVAEVKSLSGGPEGKFLLDLTPLYPAAKKVTRAGRMGEDGRSYVLADRVEGCAAGTPVRWAMMTRAKAERTDGGLVLREAGKSLKLSQIGGSWEWGIEEEPRPNEWDSPNRGFRQISFTVPASGSGATAFGVKFALQ